MCATKQINFAATHYLQVASPDFEPKLLEQITRSAQYATSASGAALVLSDGTTMSCRACSGDLGPPVGTRLNAETGFTATCVRTAHAVRCDDTETDPTVDRASCLKLGIRSILAVPIFNAQNVAGVLEVLSNDRKKFTDTHATALQLLARLVETLLNYVSPSNLSLNPVSSDTKTQDNHTDKTNDQATSLCLSCAHPNPQGSQFCNHCGVLLFSFLGTQDLTIDRHLPGSNTNADAGVKEMCNLMSGGAGPATWNEISERLLANHPSFPAQDKPQPAATKETARSTQEPAKATAATVPEPKTPEATTGLKARLGAAVRKNLWL